MKDKSGNPLIPTFTEHLRREAKRTTKNRFDAEEAIAQMEADMPMIIEVQKNTAKLRMHKFQAHIAAGFTESQALELCQGYELI